MDAIWSVGSRLRQLALIPGILLPPTALAQTLDVPFSTTCSTASYSECYTLHEVQGLNPRGDGFLAVRSGPGSNYPMVDRLFNGDQVYVFTTRGAWCGITYGDGRQGWSHRNWLQQIAG